MKNMNIRKRKLGKMDSIGNIRNVKNMDINKFNYVIYHKNCIDGFTGFFLLTKTNLLTDNCFIYPDIPAAKETPYNIKDKDVVIVDVAYKKEVLESIFKLAKTVLFMDHHITIKDDVQALIKKYKSHKVVYDDTKSGASLVWDYFFVGPAPAFVRYVEDNDIGAWKLKYTIPFITALHIKYKLEPTQENLLKWNQLFNGLTVKELIKKGIIYQEYEQWLLDVNSKRYTLELFPSNKIYSDFGDFFEKPGQYRVAVVCGNGCPNGSLLGKKLVDSTGCDFSILWTLHLDKKEYILSFRSNKVNVGEIAKKFGGGGHIYAAACSFGLDRYNITDLFFPQSLPRY